MITLYTWTTPNGRKASIGLEEAGLAYEVRPVNIGKDELRRMLRQFRDAAWDQSPLFKKIYEAEFGQLGGQRRLVSSNVEHVVRPLALEQLPRVRQARVEHERGRGPRFEPGRAGEHFGPGDRTDDHIDRRLAGTDRGGPAMDQHRHVDPRHHGP